MAGAADRCDHVVVRRVIAPEVPAQRCGPHPGDTRDGAGDRVPEGMPGEHLRLELLTSDVHGVVLAHRDLLEHDPAFGVDVGRAQQR